MIIISSGPEEEVNFLTWPDLFQAQNMAWTQQRIICILILIL